MRVQVGSVVAGRDNNKCKGPEVGKEPVCSRNFHRARMASPLKREGECWPQGGSP